METKTRSRVKAEMTAKLVRGTRVVDLGIITSPYKDRLRNWWWKKRKSRQIKKIIKRERG